MPTLRKLWFLLMDLLLPQSALDKEVATLSPERVSRKLKPSREGNTTALFDYRDPLIRHLIHTLKYRGNKHVAQIIATVLNDILLEEMADRKLFGSGAEAVLIPIPLSPSRLKARGFNQVHLIADELVSLNPTSWKTETDVLIKVRETHPQTSLRRAERKQNLKGAFALQNADKLKDKYIIVLDDVTTTGSTLQEARNTFISAGIKFVQTIAVAH